MESNESISLFISYQMHEATNNHMSVKGSSADVLANNRPHQLHWGDFRLDCRALAYASTYLLIYLQVSARKELISGSRVSMIVMVAVWILPVLNSLCVVVSVKLTEKVSFDSISAVRITGIWTQPRLVLAAILAGNVPP